MDDFREAYYWLNKNTDYNAKIMSWWDYGYQIAAMGNRTVLVDNNTWNNTHISQVGQAMSMDEDRAYEIIKRLDVDYVLVIFGGAIGYSGDDINKFLWMVRIGGSTNPDIVEKDYFNPRGDYRIDTQGGAGLLNCVLYRLSFYNFDRYPSEYRQPLGFDKVRRQEVGVKNIKLKYFTEAYTSSHWIVRIYKVKHPFNRKA